MANKYSGISSMFQKLERDIISSFKHELRNSKHFTKHMDNTKAIKVNIFDYSELINHNDELTFLDDNGNHYSLWAECDVEDLIDILISIG